MLHQVVEISSTVIKPIIIKPGECRSKCMPDFLKLPMKCVSVCVCVCVCACVRACVCVCVWGGFRNEICRERNQPNKTKACLISC